MFGCLLAGVQIHILSWVSHRFYTKEELRLLYRHEWKHPVAPGDLFALRARLGSVLQRDAHTVDGRYQIRSLYFDNLRDKALR